MIRGLVKDRYACRLLRMLCGRSRKIPNKGRRGARQFGMGISLDIDLGEVSERERVRCKKNCEHLRVNRLVRKGKEKKAFTFYIVT